MRDVKGSLQRFYLSLSVVEVRNSSMFGEADRMPYNSVLYLDYISARPGCTASELAEVMGVTKATVSATISRLEDKGMIVRERSESDGRVRHIYLSEEMQRSYREYEVIVTKMIEKVVADHSEEELEAFTGILGELSAMLEGFKCPDGDGSEHSV